MNDQTLISPPVGLIGLGLVGTALAHRMRLAGFHIIGFDINPEQCKRNSEFSVQIAASPMEIAEQCSRVVLSLPDSNIVQEMLLNADGFFSTSTHPKIIIDTTTGEPSQVRFISNEVRQKGSVYCDACIIGSSVMIHDGDSVLVVGAEETTLGQIHDILNSWTPHIFHMGEVGSGSKAKLVVNHVIGLNRLVVSEGLVLAESLGLNLHKILDVLKSGVSYSKIMDTKGEKMIQRNFEPQARLRQHLKDVRLINSLGREYHSPLPLSSIHESLLQQGIDMGLGDVDNSAVIEILRYLKKDS